MTRIALALLMTTGMIYSQTAPPAQNWDALVDSYFDEAVLPFGPSNAVQEGFHAYDAQLEEFSQPNIQKEIAAARRYEARFNAFPVSKLSPDQQADRDMVLSSIHSTLLELESIR